MVFGSKHCHFFQGNPRPSWLEKPQQKLRKKRKEKLFIELLNNKLHGLLPPGGLVSPSGGFASLLFDQVLHFASIILCQASWM